MSSFMTKQVRSLWKTPGQAGLRSITVIFLALLLTSSVACAQPKSSVKAEDSSSVAQTAEKTVLIPIDGMSCGACAARVRKTLRAMNGVADVAVDLEHRNARVKYVAAKTSPDQLAAAINSLGYKAGTPAVQPDKSGAPAAPAKGAGSMETKSVRIPVTGMACEEMCVARVKQTLAAIDGVTKVDVSLKQGEARVEYIAAKTSPERLVAAIQKLGFKTGSPAPQSTP